MSDDRTTKLQPLKVGDRIVIRGDHPWVGEVGTLAAFEPYGPEIFGWKGWRVDLDAGFDCYCAPEKMRKLNVR